jgi:hypothetical protein
MHPSKSFENQTVSWFQWSKNMPLWWEFLFFLSLSF